jgi:hypothetical protein
MKSITTGGRNEIVHIVESFLLELEYFRYLLSSDKIMISGLC